MIMKKFFKFLNEIFLYNIYITSISTFEKRYQNFLVIVKLYIYPTKYCKHHQPIILNIQYNKEVFITILQKLEIYNIIIEKIDN